MVKNLTTLRASEDKIRKILGCSEFSNVVILTH